MIRDYRLYINDILDSILKIELFVGELSFEEFVDDDKTASAVVRKIEIIGEASKNLPLIVRNKYPDIPWSDMARMRDKIIHCYFGIDYEIVWKVIKDRLPEIRLEMERILREMSESK